MESRLAHLSPFILCALYLVSFYGFGFICTKALETGLKLEKVGTPPLLPIGVSAFIAFAGILTSLHLAFYEIFLSVLLASSLVGGLLLYANIKRKKYTFFSGFTINKAYYLSGLFLVALLAFIMFESSLLHQTSFNKHDDYHSYFVGPIKLLQTGWLGFEPFGHRFLTTSIGGYHAFLAYGMVLGNEDFLYFFEFWVGCACVAEILWAQLKHRQQGFGLFVCCLLFAVICLQPTVNASSTFTSAGLFIAAFYFYFYPLTNRTVSNIVLSLFLSALLVIKSSNLPGVGLFFLFVLWHKRNYAPILVIGIATLILTFPWGFSHYQTTGTFFYPFLGNGYSCYDPPFFILDYHWAFSKTLLSFVGAIWEMPVVLLCFAILALHLLMPSPYKNRTLLALLVISLTLCLSILARFGPFEQNTPSAYLRYGAPFWQALSWFLIMEIKWNKQKTQIPRHFLLNLGLVLWAIFFCTLTTKAIDKKRSSFRRAVAHKESRQKYDVLISPLRMKSYLYDAQQNIPAGARLFARSSRPHLLNFSRNEIFVSDQPNFTGLQRCKGAQENSPQQLAAYFLKNDIRYILYSYGDEAGFQKGEFGFWLKREDLYWREWAKRTFDFHETLLKMKETYTPIYDDSFNFVLDLNKPKK